MRCPKSGIQTVILFLIWTIRIFHGGGKCKGILAKSASPPLIPGSGKDSVKTGKKFTCRWKRESKYREAIESKNLSRFVWKNLQMKISCFLVSFRSSGSLFWNLSARAPNEPKCYHSGLFCSPEIETNCHRQGYFWQNIFIPGGIWEVKQRLLMTNPFWF